MKSITVILLIFSINFCVVKSRRWNILWERRYCSENLSDQFAYPFITDCSLCTTDQLRLYTPDESNYENIYRVETEEEMLACNATNAMNTIPTVFNTETIFTLINSGSRNPAFNFYFGQQIYFISTSNGTEFSARNDLTREVNSCLKFSFFLATKWNNCGNFDTCNMTSVFTDNSSKVGCQSYVTEQTTRNFTDNSTLPNATHSPTFSSLVFDKHLKNMIVFLAVGLFAFLLVSTVGIITVIILFRLVYWRRSRNIVLLPQHQLEQRFNDLNDGGYKELEKNSLPNCRDSFEFIEPDL